MGVRLKTINADEAAYEGFRQLAKECKLTSPELVAAMVQYFRVTKADPREPTGPDLTTLLAKLGAKIDGLDKRTIGFIREQEKQYLKPILAEVRAHKVLSTPAPGALVGLSDAQEDDLIRWLSRVLSRGIQAVHLTPQFLSEAPAMGATKTAEDPALAHIKKAFVGMFQTAFRPEFLTPALAPKPTTPSPSPAVPPIQPA